MRLKTVERGHRLVQRLVFRMMHVLGASPPDVVRMVLYRPGLFGKPYSAWIQAVMRGPNRPGRYNTIRDRKSTRLNSSHLGISYAVFCLKKKKKTRYTTLLERVQMF